MGILHFCIICQFSMLFNENFAFLQFSMLFNGMRLRSFSGGGDGRTDGRMEGRTDGRTDGRMEGRKNGCLEIPPCVPFGAAAQKVFSGRGQTKLQSCIECDSQCNRSFALPIYHCQLIASRVLRAVGKAVYLD